MVGQEPIATISRGRERAYRFLGRAIGKEVDKTFLAQIVEMQPILSSIAEPVHSADLREGCAKLERFVQTALWLEGDTVEGLILELSTEYASLFLNAGANYVPLFESVYLDRQHLLYGQPYFDVKKIYEKLGLTRLATFEEPEDHIAAELEFMANLAHWTERSIDKGKIEFARGFVKNQREFLDEHLLKWAPEMCKMLLEVNPSEFYSSLAYLIRGYLALDYETVCWMEAALA